MLPRVFQAMFRFLVTLFACWFNDRMQQKLDYTQVRSLGVAALAAHARRTTSASSSSTSRGPAGGNRHRESQLDLAAAVLVPAPLIEDAPEQARVPVPASVPEPVPAHPPHTHCPAEGDALGNRQLGCKLSQTKETFFIAPIAMQGCKLTFRLLWNGEETEGGEIRTLTYEWAGTSESPRPKIAIEPHLATLQYDKSKLEVGRDTSSWKTSHGVATFLQSDPARVIQASFWPTQGARQ